MKPDLGFGDAIEFDRIAWRVTGTRTERWVPADDSASGWREMARDGDEWTFQVARSQMFGCSGFDLGRGQDWPGLGLPDAKTIPTDRGSQVRIRRLDEPGKGAVVGKVRRGEGTLHPAARCGLDDYAPAYLHSERMVELLVVAIEVDGVCLRYVHEGDVR